MAKLNIKNSSLIIILLIIIVIIWLNSSNNNDLFENSTTSNNSMTYYNNALSNTTPTNNPLLGLTLNNVNTNMIQGTNQILNTLSQQNTSYNTMSDLIPAAKSLGALVGEIFLKLSNISDVNKLMVGGVFKLKVNLPMLPPYIKGVNFDTSVGKNPNYFYLCIAKPDPNCNIVSINGSCLSLYIDNKNCTNKKLSISSQSSPYRLILISEQYANDVTLPFLDNTTFSLVNINNNLYLKNVAIGCYPSLFKDDISINVYGNMINDANSNINKIPDLVNNNVCNEYVAPIDLSSSSLNVNCLIKPDDQMYLMTSNDITLSSPIDFKVNNDNTINMSLKTFNSYGYVNDTYSMIFGDYNIDTFKYIEKITIPNLTPSLATFFINMVCFDSNTTGKLSSTNKLNFMVEQVSLPQNFIKTTSII